MGPFCYLCSCLVLVRVGQTGEVSHDQGVLRVTRKLFFAPSFFTGRVSHSTHGELGQQMNEAGATLQTLEITMTLPMVVYLDKVSNIANNMTPRAEMSPLFLDVEEEKVQSLRSRHGVP